MVALFTRNYIIGTMSYGLIRKAILTHNASYKMTDYDIDKSAYVTKEYPMLLTDRIAVCGVGAFANIYLWPIYLYRDLQRSELHLRDLDKEYYFKQYTNVGMIDYLVK